MAWEQSQFYCFYCCSPPLRHHHRQHHHQHQRQRQLVFKLSSSLSSFFFHCHHPHDLGRIPVLLLLLLFSNSTQASLQPLYSHTPKLPANYISNTIRIISKLNKEERTRIDCIVIILLTLISMHKVLNDFPFSKKEKRWPLVKLLMF